MACIGLALSGGGFRATLYHLGVIRYLRDNGTLPFISDIAAVSGGSILAAHLMLNWDRYTGSDVEFAEAAAEIVRFVQPGSSRQTPCSSGPTDSFSTATDGSSNSPRSRPFTSSPPMSATASWRCSTARGCTSRSG